jgi:hypothetical protein
MDMSILALMVTPSTNLRKPRIMPMTELEEAVMKERARCAAIARNGANFFRDKPIKFVTPEKYAADLADDIADAIERGDQP